MTHPDLADEQAVNRSYLARLDAKAQIVVGYGTARNQQWTCPGSVRGGPVPDRHPLIGRVGLETEDESLGRSFYIGPRRLMVDGMCVISWAAPAAALFFRPGDGSGHDVDPEGVVVRRTMDNCLEDIADLADTWVRPVVDSPFAKTPLIIPAPDAPTRRRPRGQRPAPFSEHTPAPTHSDETTGVARSESPRAETAGAPPLDEQLPVGLGGMRAAELVLRRLAAPRTSRLVSVLATLQPDQHSLVTWPANEPLVVQGHPGTGKTIVAAYRAAYLVDPDRDPRAGSRPTRVALVGPTPGYAAHVRGLLEAMGAERKVWITDLGSLLAGTVDIRTAWEGSIDGACEEMGTSVRGAADAAVRRLRAENALKTGPGARPANLRAVYDMVAANGTEEEPLLSRPEDMEWTVGLPSFGRALGRRRFLPLFAQYALALGPPPPTDLVDHFIVDEAQDVSTLEWNVLCQRLAPTGQWTLVGDMNQRRADTSYRSWFEVGEHLMLGDGDTAVCEQVMHRGYRSTTAILAYADRLLPLAEQGATSIQAGGSPVGVVRAPGSEEAALAVSTVDVAERLLDRHPDGTVAVITVLPGPAFAALFAAGWRRGKDPSSWHRQDRSLRLLVPEDARGLEFDGVVVVEPADFPDNLGRSGQLYTSLTRANRELAVVHQRPLPTMLATALA